MSGQSVGTPDQDRWPEEAKYVRFIGKGMGRGRSIPCIARPKYVRFIGKRGWTGVKSQGDLSMSGLSVIRGGSAPPIRSPEESKYVRSIGSFGHSPARPINQVAWHARAPGEGGKGRSQLCPGYRECRIEEGGETGVAEGKEHQSREFRRFSRPEGDRIRGCLGRRDHPGLSWNRRSGVKLLASVREGVRPRERGLAGLRPGSPPLDLHGHVLIPIGSDPFAPPEAALPSPLWASRPWLAPSSSLVRIRHRRGRRRPRCSAS
jgi:hypothetical protein